MSKRLTVPNVVKEWVGYNEQPWRNLDGEKVTDGLNGPDGRASNLSYSRQVLRSYNMAIACYHPSKFHAEKGFCLITSQKIASPWHTTLKHVNMAIRHVKWTQFSVPHTGTLGNYAHTMTVEEHTANLNFLKNDIDELARRSIKNFRVREEQGYNTIGSFAGWIEIKYHEIRKYMTMTGTPFPKLPELDDILKHINDERERRWAKWTDPVEMAKRERREARREAIKALGLNKGEEQ